MKQLGSDDGNARQDLGDPTTWLRPLKLEEGPGHRALSWLQALYRIVGRVVDVVTYWERFHCRAWTRLTQEPERMWIGPR